MSVLNKLAELAVVLVLAAAAPTHGAEAGVPVVFARPPIIRFGAGVSELEQSLGESCGSLDTREIDPPFLPDVERRQMQIDCDGFEFRGRPRWAEFVFRDDSLVMVWILTTAEEEAEILTAMTAAYGEPSHRGADWFGFVDHLAAIRRDKPEVLFYSEALADVYREWFAENVGE